MNRLEQTLLDEVTGGVQPRLAISSKTRIDVGYWWRAKRAWLCVVNDSLFMLAVGRRRYIAFKKLADIPDTYYCHATGQLVLEPSEDLTFSRFRMSPGEALKLLEEIKLR